MQCHRKAERSMYLIKPYQSFICPEHDNIKQIQKNAFFSDDVLLFNFTADFSLNLTPYQTD